MNEDVNRLYQILCTFLGESKNGLNSNLQGEWGCPRCSEIHGNSEMKKYNLSISLLKQQFQCWKCSAHDDEMHGSIKKLFKLYGNEELWKQYKDIIYSIKNNKLYKLNYKDEDFNIEYNSITKEELVLPPNYHRLNKDKYIPKNVMDYLIKRNIDFDIIDKFEIGYTNYDENNKQVSSRIIIPSYDKMGNINYWTGRDFTNLEFRQKYYNPKVERKNIIFNEDKINYDCDITLVEGPFDHIVVPNSIPLLGKVLKEDFEIYKQLMKNCNANINIWLDNDAREDAIKVYSLLNHGRLYNKIRIINPLSDKDPSDIYEKYGKKGIIDTLRQTTQLKEIFLNL